MKPIISIIFIWAGLLMPVNLQAQAYKTAQNTHITFGSGPTCEVGTDVCGLTQGKHQNANVQMSYNPKTQVLIWTFAMQTLEPDNKQKLTARKNTHGQPVYTFTKDYVLPADILQTLGLKGTYYIPKGQYDLLIKDQQIFLILKLLKK